jgi:hypothetical protein
VLVGVEPEAVDAGAPGQRDVGGEHVVAHLGDLGLQVGQAAHRAGDGVDLAVAFADADPGLAGGGLARRIAGGVAGVVVDHVEQHLDAALVAPVDQGLQVGLGAEMRVHLLEVVIQ